MSRFHTNRLGVRFFNSTTGAPDTTTLLYTIDIRTHETTLEFSFVLGRVNGTRRGDVTTDT